MRITAEAKAETRERILGAAAKMFARKGWEQTTTRGIATAAGIATGTLFNYFETKEAIAAALIGDALTSARERWRRRAREHDSLEEALFALVWAELRSLRPVRTFLPAAAETILSPLRRAGPHSEEGSIRADHLEAVEAIIASHGVAQPLPAVAMQLYWTLYLGVLAHWATDDSPNQEDTLALLDHSLRLFVASLPGGHHGSHARQAE